MAEFESGPLGGGVPDLVSTNKGGVQQLGNIVDAILNVFPRINGTFTLSAATTTGVSNGNVAANTIIVPFATNATAALIVRTNGLYHSANTAGTGFVISTQSGSATSGGTFAYVGLTPS